MAETKSRLKELSGPAGILGSAILAVAALLTSVLAKPADALPERIIRVEMEVRFIKETLTRIEKKLDLELERKEK